MRSFSQAGQLSLDFSGPKVHLRPKRMNLVLSAHNITLTKAIEDHIVGKIEKLEHLDRFAIDARVTLEHDHTRLPARQF
jgi:hypothetical protein